MGVNSQVVLYDLVFIIRCVILCRLLSCGPMCTQASFLVTVHMKLSVLTIFSSGAI